MNATAIGTKVARELASSHSLSFVSTKEETFFRRMKALPYVDRIDIHDLKQLQTAFKQATTEDPYSLSPTYYGLTGRRGLWIQECEAEDTAMIFCLHPNKKDTVLIFPPFGMQPEKMLKDFLENISDLSMNIQIGRVYKEDNHILQFANAARGLKAEIVPEKTLDWAYPVHTISCRALSERSGKDYSRLRQAYNKFTRLGATMQPIDFETDQQLLERLAQAWEASNNAKNQKKHYDEYDDSIPVDYFLRLIKIARQKGVELRGLIVSVDDEPQGFSIWEPPYNRSKAANLFASQISKFEGNSNLVTFLTIKTAEAILAQGGSYMCLGGSEFKNLDEYKRGFRPHKSKDLVTINVTRENSL